MTEQPQANPEHVINILRIRLNDEIYQRALLEAAYNQQTQKIDQLTRELAEKELKEQWTHPQNSGTTTPPQDTSQTDAAPADTSQTHNDTKSP